MNQIRSSLTKTISASALAFAAVGLLCSQVNGQSTIAYWNFDGWASNQSAALPGGNPIPVQIPADTGSGAGSSFVYTSPDHTGTSGTGIKGFVGGATGTTVNTPVFDQNGVSSLNLLNGTTTAGQALIGNGEYLDVAFPMSGQSNIGVSFATLKSSAAAFNSNQWSYSTDGTNFTNFGSVINPVTGGYSLIGPIIATGLNGFSGTAYLRYTLNGATGTASTPSNRFDNLLIQSGASAAPAPNPVSLPAAGDIVLGLNNADASNTLEFVRGSVTQNGGTRFPAPTYQFTTPTVITPAPLPFIESVRFDNYAGVSHNAHGNLIGIDFGTTTVGTGGGKIYSLATTGTTSSPAAQLIGATSTNTPIGSTTGTITQTRVAGLSVSPDNTKIAVVGTDQGRVLVYDYTAGNSAGTGAALANGRQTATQPLGLATTQGTAWKDNNNVLAFSAHGNIISVDQSTMAVNDVGVASQDVVTPELGSNVTALYYNSAISPYLYALYSGFAAAATPQSQTRLYVFDPTNNYALLTTQTSAGLPGIDLSGLSTLPNQGQASMTGRDIALDKNGNLFIGGFDSTITYLPAADFANPAAIAAIPHNSSIFYYGSKYDATAFPGLDVSLGASTVGIAGDYNGDGKVDAADYVTWRKNPGANGGDPAGYTTWRANFGTGGPGAGLGAGAVPEPTGLLMLAIGLLITGCLQRRCG